MGPMKIASAHKQVYKIFKKVVGHELFLNQNLGHATKKFGNHWSKTMLFNVSSIANQKSCCGLAVSLRFTLVNKH